MTLFSALRVREQAQPAGDLAQEHHFEVVYVQQYLRVYTGRLVSYR